MLDVVDYWLSMGVDGLRLDAVPYLYAREGTTCENLPETFAFLRQLRAHVDSRFDDRMLLAEANQWPEDAVAYMGNGDTCHMAFHFPLMPRMFMAARQEDRFPMVDILGRDAGHASGVPMGTVPAQSRRAHTRDGHRRGAGLYVPRLRAGPAGPGECRHPTTSCPAAGQRPQAHGDDERSPVLHAGDAHHLLRRRNRDGRQHLPRRPQRGAHADAVEQRPQRRVLRRQSSTAVPARHHRPGIPLASGER
jgi:glycosidase